MNAIGYLRLSSKDQSKSLEYQESTVREYCRRNNLEVLGFFKDNGEDSYTFDRPNYKELEAFVKKYKGKCQYLIVLDHDRFSRNLPEALMKIAELERNYGVKVLSTNERVDLDTSDPDVFMKRAFDYMIANKELFTIRARTKQGMRNAKEGGRYIGRAPYGYKNINDGSKRNLIEIDDFQAVIVKRVFRDYLLGVAPYIIYRNVKSMGFTLTGNSAIFKMLGNCVYAGLIKVPSYRDLPEKYVKGLHEPIISENEYWMVERLLSSKRPTKVRADEEFPLRGVMRCVCGAPFTAGWSKGKLKYYLYYRCNVHSNINVPGIKIHEQFDRVLKTLSFDQRQLWLLKEIVKEIAVAPLKEKHKKLNEKVVALAALNKKILNLEERFLSNEIETSTYQTWFKKFKEEKALLETAIDPKENKKAIQNDGILRVMPALTNLFGIYDKCNIYQKHAIIRAVFKDNLSYGSGIFRTPYIDPTFQDKTLMLNKKGLLIYEQSFKISEDNPLCTLEGIRTPDPRFRKPLLYPTELPRHLPVRSGKDRL
jgi:site-specific DNA recombinase